MAEIRTSSSANLKKKFTQAKKSAIDGKVGRVTVVGVGLINMEMIERGEKRRSNM
jgi:hypothetical protein